jgi:hypothetical protein
MTVHHARRATVGGVLLWGFVTLSLAYGVFLIVLGLSR